MTTAFPVQRRIDDGGLDAHTADFVECIRTREQPKCNAAVAARAGITAHLGNIAFRTGRRLAWSDETRSFPEDPEANAMLLPEYHGPWEVPVI